MKALARLPAVQGIAAMNSINVMAVMLAYHVPSNNALAALELGSNSSPRSLGDALCVAESAMSASLRQSEEEKCPRL